MPITVMTDVILPNTVIAEGIRGKRIRKNTRVEHGETGYMSINVGWSQSLRQFELGFVPMSLENWKIIQDIYEITEGGAYGFLMEDPTDSDAGLIPVHFDSDILDWEMVRPGAMEDRIIAGPSVVLTEVRL